MQISNEEIALRLKIKYPGILAELLAEAVANSTEFEEKMKVVKNGSESAE
jgi:hypothetical protein